MLADRKALITLDKRMLFPVFREPGPSCLDDERIRENEAA
jgi:hypothetical protein